MNRRNPLILLLIAVISATTAGGQSVPVDADAAPVVSKPEAPWPYLHSSYDPSIWEGTSLQACSASCDSSVACDAWSEGCDGGRKQPKQTQWYGGLEYLNWWSSERSLPALVAGGDGLPPSPLLFGGGQIGDDYQSGLRITIGNWRDACQTSGFLLRGYGADGSDQGISLQSDGSTPFAIPFFNVGSNPLFNGPDSLILSDAAILQPGAPASVRARATNEVTGADFLFRKLYQQGCGYRVDWIAGFQYSDIDDDVMLSTSTSRIGGPRLATFDSFDAENRFYAGSIGFMIERGRGPLTMQMLGKIGLGNMNQRVSVRGQNSVNGTVTGGGIFAQNQSAAGGPNFNVGDYEQDEFAVSPEFSIKAIRCFRHNIKLSLGYTFIYWSEVALAGNHIDTRVNRDVLFDGPFIPGGGGNPSFAFNSQDYWAHTLDLGLSLQY